MKTSTKRLSHRPALAAAALAALAGLAACNAGPAVAELGSEEPAVPAPPTEGGRLYPGFDLFARPASAVSDQARPFVEHGLQWLYGFNDDEAVRCFLRAAELDEECAIAWWGIAYANGININDPVLSEREARDAYDAVQRALALREHATPVDRAL